MEAEFWHQRWGRGEIGFHQDEVNPLLAAHFQQLGLTAGCRVFIPLCGKSLDMVWLLAQGYQVVGAELSELAVRELFDTLDLQPEISSVGSLKHYQGEGIDIYVGDIFDLTRDVIGQVDAVYDRAAMVALPDQVRARYSAHLLQLTEVAPQLLITYSYDQSLLAGPPFSISAEEVSQHYGEAYQITRAGFFEEVFKGVDAVETAWLLRG